MNHSTLKVSKVRNQIFSILGLIGLWWAFALIINKAYILPSPPLVLSSLVDLLKTPSLYRAVMGTLIRTFFCIVLSLMGGVILGLTAGTFEPLRGVLAPFLQVMRTLPTIVIIVYVIIWMSSTSAPIFVTLLISLPIIYSNVLEGYDHTSIELVEMTTFYRFSKMKTLKLLYIPSVKPFVKAGAVSITSLSLKVMIASEVLSQTQGSLGKAFQMAKINIQTERVFALALITIFLSFGLERFIKKVTV